MLVSIINNANKIKSLLQAIEIEKGNSAGIPFDEIWGELMKDKEFVREYEGLRPEYEKIEQTINSGSII